MKRRHSFLAATGLLLTFGLAQPAAALSNQLKAHPSPYLALHGADPTAWQEWNAQAVKQARAENKLLFISIGYFSCHWCHVMQRESYRNREIAALLNARFIPVKVDRELEPALDTRLIEFAEATRGMSGWPLNVFVTPDGDPLYATLYLPPDEFLKLLHKLDTLWRVDRERLATLARREAGRAQGPGKPQLDAKQVEAHARKLAAAALRQADPLNGGFGEQNKFPSVPQLESLLARHAAQPDPKLKEFLVLTLDHMAARGLQDHLGGGFFRYTTDPNWNTPHFEKMLYDNALLARLYLRAAQVLQREDYARVARRTLDFMLARLRAPGGAFIAALSAVDGKGVEGGYYLWRKEELAGLLDAQERAAYQLAWGMRDAAPFDAGYLPVTGLAPAEVAAQLKIAPAESEALLARAADKLRAARAKRVLPADTKQLAGWNGLALSAFAEAARVTGEERYRGAAKGVRDYLVNSLWAGNALQRAVAKGKPVGKSSLEDYAYVAAGLLDWAELTGQDADYALAAQVARAGWKRFYGVAGWRLSEDSLIQAERGADTINDGPMPAPSAVLAAASRRLADKTDDPRLRELALSALNSGHQQIEENPFWYATQIAAQRAATPD